MDRDFGRDTLQMELPNSFAEAQDGQARAHVVLQIGAGGVFAYLQAVEVLSRFGVDTVRLRYAASTDAANRIVSNPKCKALGSVWQLQERGCKCTVKPIGGKFEVCVLLHVPFVCGFGNWQEMQPVDALDAALDAVWLSLGGNRPNSGDVALCRYDVGVNLNTEREPKEYLKRIARLDGFGRKGGFYNEGERLGAAYFQRQTSTALQTVCAYDKTAEELRAHDTDIGRNVLRFELRMQELRGGGLFWHGEPLTLARLSDGYHGELSRYFYSLLSGNLTITDMEKIEMDKCTLDEVLRVFARNWVSASGREPVEVWETELKPLFAGKGATKQSLHGIKSRFLQAMERAGGDEVADELRQRISELGDGF